jgi:hypothetical protein
MLNGIQLAVDDIHAVGGYLGRPLELVIKDDKARLDDTKRNLCVQRKQQPTLHTLHPRAHWCAGTLNSGCCLGCPWRGAGARQIRQRC